MPLWVLIARRTVGANRLYPEATSQEENAFLGGELALREKGEVGL